MRDKDYFGNLINEKEAPYSLRYFKANALIQEGQKGVYRLYILGDSYAVAKCIGNNIVDYCILGNVYDYKELYTNSRNSKETLRQALYHGACILEGVNLGYNL